MGEGRSEYHYVKKRNGYMCTLRDAVCLIPALSCVTVPVAILRALLPLGIVGSEMGCESAVWVL